MREKVVNEGLIERNKEDFRGDQNKGEDRRAERRSFLDR